MVRRASPFLTLSRAEWAERRAATPLSLSEDDLANLRGARESVSLDEVTDVYLPVSRLLNLHVAAAHELHRVTARFLGENGAPVPYVIGIAGSVAVGKSTTARILQALLSRWPDHPRVELVTTDGFLFSNDTLTNRHLLARKGFPESYDVVRLVQFMADLKAGVAVAAPVYSHVTYDVVAGAEQALDRPDIVIVEGVNVLQAPVTRPRARAGGATGRGPAQFVSDYFDFSIYVDAATEDVARWYVERFLDFRRTAFADPSSYFHRYRDLSDVAAEETARALWTSINEVNLRENIEPTRARARLILEKGPDHTVRTIRLRRL